MHKSHTHIPTHTQLGYHSELLLRFRLNVRLPQLDGLVLRPRGKRCAVRAPRDPVNPSCMAKQSNLIYRMRTLPHTYSSLSLSLSLSLIYGCIHALLHTATFVRSFVRTQVLMAPERRVCSVFGFVVLSLLQHLQYRDVLWIFPATISTTCAEFHQTPEHCTHTHTHTHT